MKEALGLVETRGLSNAILVADAMSKTANIKIIEVENSRGLGYMTVKIAGDVGAVNAAVACGKQIAIENNSFVTAKVIPRPSNDVEVTFCQLNNKNDNVSKENSISENDEKNYVETENIVEVNSEVVVSEPLNNSDKLGELSEDSVEQTSMNGKEIEKAEIEKDKNDEEKSKTKRSGRKKQEPKNKEE